jgi:hypothetical protein
MPAIRNVRLLRSIGLAVSALALAEPALALEALDGRLEVHGYYEAQIRSIVRDFDFSDDWDLTQWWNVLNLEIEAAVAPDGWGPFDSINVFGRIEVRYDCVWTRACSFFDSANAYGPHIGRLPKRLSDARRSGFAGTHWNGDTRHYYEVPFEDVNSTPNRARLRPSGSRVPIAFYQTPIGAPFFSSDSYGLDRIPALDERFQLQSSDDPTLLYFEQMLRPHCDAWSVRARPMGSQDGRGNADILLLDPACNYDTIGANADKPSPFRTGDVHPVTGARGSGALPYRPAPDYDFDSGAPLDRARGAYYPNYRLQQLLREGDLEPWRTKLRRSEVAWNRGQSQQDQKELKELYADVELFDSRLWLRIGYQTIVWGKTELFRNQDQFNPQDIGLGSLTSLEESRISLWAVRAVWSFYDVGPLNDVRLELAMNYDQFEPTDLGTCGEPYTVLAACALSVGQLAHGYFGLGLAGQQRPPDPWNDAHGIEYGGRLEFRWDRFSFAITDFYGFQDFPYVESVYSYGRNVDPVSGRIRHTESTGRCRSGREPACLDDTKALTEHPANQQLFAMVCANTVGLAPTLDPAACFANVFNSPLRAADPLPGVDGPRIVVALTLLGRGDTDAGLVDPGSVLATVGEFPADGRVQAEIQRNSYNGMLGKATVNLNVDPFDGDRPDIAGASPDNPILAEGPLDNSVNLYYGGGVDGSLSGRLTDWQEALLGCGPFFRTSCDLDGIDLLNAEASVVTQSFPNVEGTFRGADRIWDTTDDGLVQPGTVGFEGGPICARFENGKTYILPGCRGPGDDGYNVKQDGTTAGVIHPFTGQQFKNELGALSWNLLMGLVALSIPGTDPRSGAPLPADRAEFDVNAPFRQDGCSFREPQWCGVVTGFLGLTGTRRNSIEAGGNGRFGRRDFVWQTGGMGVARFDKSNILGFSLDFAEDVTKSNWGVEFTWVNDIHLADNNAFRNVSQTDSYRLTISVDRPTFVNFLNANHTFFINTQWFFEYQDGYRRGFNNDGPWDIFGVLFIGTGYFQDRLLPGLTLVYFVRNNSFAVLPEVTYRFTENFSATFGVAAFGGREQERVMPINEISTASERFGRNAYKSSVQNGLAVIRERDEIFLRVKYTF